jgi:hypothetical protein
MRFMRLSRSVFSRSLSSGVAGSLSPRLLENTHNLGFEFREFHGQHHAARMKDQVAAGGQQIDVTADGLSHAALDAIALVRLAQHFSGSEAGARRARGIAAGRLRREKPAHRGRLPFARCLIGALVIGVFA